jgi:ProP effector
VSEATSNTKPRSMRDTVRGTRQILVERFPQTFRGFGEPKLPLKVGIRGDLFNSPVVADLDNYAIGCAIRDYCTGPTYHSQMLTGATRVDLEGKAAGTVNDTAERYHATQFARVTHKRRQRAEAHAAKRAEKRKPKTINLDEVTSPMQLLFVSPTADVSAIHHQNESAA